MKKIIFVSILFLTACSNKQKVSEKNLTDSLSNEKSELKKEKSFEEEMYLQLWKVSCGDVFIDSQTGRDTFYRIVEIPSEEHLMVYSEKISFEGEGSHHKLEERYLVENIYSGNSNMSIHSLDSLVFIDSVTISCYVNREKHKVDLAKKKFLN